MLTHAQTRPVRYRWNARAHRRRRHARHEPRRVSRFSACPTCSTASRSPGGPTGSSFTTRLRKPDTSWTRISSPGCATRTSLPARRDPAAAATVSRTVMPGIRELLPAAAVARRHLSRPAHRQLRGGGAHQAGATSICGTTSAAAPSATMRRIATRWCRSRVERARGCGLARSTTPTSSSLATRRTMSRARCRGCATGGGRDRALHRRSAPRDGRADRAEGSERHGGVPRVARIGDREPQPQEGRL